MCIRVGILGRHSLGTRYRSVGRFAPSASLPRLHSLHTHIIHNPAQHHSTIVPTQHSPFFVKHVVDSMIDYFEFSEIRETSDEEVSGKPARSERTATRRDYLFQSSRRFAPRLIIYFNQIVASLLG